MSELIVSALLLIGAFFLFSGSLGVLRFRDVYNRLHAATKSSTLGIIGILLGGFIYFWHEKGIVSGKLLIGIFFVMLTAPVAAHMLGRAAYKLKIPMQDNTIHNALKEDVHDEEKNQETRG
ncbi:monovalent cation/H(+) antiporter subunit G [Aureibacillus halotolerans]|uniref:Multisubunit sodium/proton antiporter MrpG subunit n=1 Tax=Aureibacillus halotolerans TaxID=1508390 RepID=A0A4R6TYS7_9BACI|nr:monovalent cation/H(+) antiporter subunit G [Aureibacillus halotolerans]TDQ38022.1 multisubunit sodium/proton antiporter MrpG subunit [Aureibacillus halotolerans]